MPAVEVQADKTPLRVVAAGENDDVVVHCDLFCFVLCLLQGGVFVCFVSVTRGWSPEDRAAQRLRSCRTRLGS